MTFDDFLIHVRPFVRGCPEDLAVEHVRQAARRFCARTLVWQYSTDPILSVAGKPDYTLQLAPGTEPVRVLAIEVAGTPYSMPEGPAGRRMYRNKVGNVATMLNLYDFRLSPAPGADDQEIIADVAVRPADRATQVNVDDVSGPVVEWPDDLGEYATDIAHGAIASLRLLPGADWTNEAGSAIEEDKFRERMGIVSLKVQRGMGNGRLGGNNITWR